MSWPLGYKCNHARHELEHCLRCLALPYTLVTLHMAAILPSTAPREDYIIRMKEYERERRLRLRAKRIAAAAGAEEEEE